MDVSMFEPKVTKWLLKPEGRFSELHHNLLKFGLNLSPPDPNKPNVCYYTVMPDYRLVCNSTKDYIFQFELETVYEIENNGVKPTPELLFEIAKNNIVIMNTILKINQKVIIFIIILFLTPFTIIFTPT